MTVPLRLVYTGGLDDTGAILLTLNFEERSEGYFINHGL